jgi:hypothetical protein
MTENAERVDPERRRILALLAGAGAGAAVFGRALSALAEGAAKVTAGMVKQAEWISGVAFTDAERELMLSDLNETAEGLAALRAVALDNAVPPAIVFAPAVRRRPRREAPSSPRGGSARGAARRRTTTSPSRGCGSWGASSAREGLVES